MVAAAASEAFAALPLSVFASAWRCAATLVVIRDIFLPVRAFPAAVDGRRGGRRRSVGRATRGQTTWVFSRTRRGRLFAVFSNVRTVIIDGLWGHCLLVRTITRVYNRHPPPILSSPSLHRICVGVIAGAVALLIARVPLIIVAGRHSAVVIDTCGGCAVIVSRSARGRA